MQAGPEQVNDVLGQARKFLVAQGSGLCGPVLEEFDPVPEGSFLPLPAGRVVPQDLEQQPGGVEEHAGFETEG